MAKIILLRHGESKANKEIKKDIAGWFNSKDDLTKEGIKQIEKVCDDLKK